MALEFVKSNKGVDFLVKDGYTFHKEKVINDKKNLAMHRISESQM